jgi:pilus assembly protein CpaF
MNAFGKRNGMGGGNSQRPQFGVARPMKAGPGSAASTQPQEVEGGEQFPPIDDLNATPDSPSSEAPPPPPNGHAMGALDKLNQRQNASGEAANSKTEGFEASVHRIKEQVLPRLLERVARTSWPRNSGRSSPRCSSN